MLKEFIILATISSSIYAAESGNLISTVETNQEDTKRLNRVIVILIDKVNELTINQDILLKKLNLDTTSNKKRDIEYKRKLLELKKLKKENEKSEEELKKYIKSQSQSKFTKEKEMAIKKINKKDKINLNKIEKISIKDISPITSKKIVSIKVEDVKIIKVEDVKITKVEDVNITKVEDVNTTKVEDVNITKIEDDNIKKFIIRLETTTEKRKNLSLERLNKIDDKELRENILLRPIGGNKLILETKIGYDYNTTKKNILEYNKVFKNSFFVNEDKDRLNNKTVYIIQLGTIKNEQEMAYIFRRIKNKELQEGLYPVKKKRGYKVVTKDYSDFNLMKEDLKKYKKVFKKAFYKSEVRKKDGK